jgi:hypothetical protein
MKTKKFFAVEISDSTCNVLGHESGIYGKGDYSWITESLNGGNGNIDMTREEAEEVKADFEQVIKEKNLEWASADIIEVEVEVADTMQDIADYYNECDVLDTAALERMIEDNGWVSDCATEWGICHNDTEKVVINDNGEAVVVPMEANPALDALMDAKRQLDVEGWWIPTNDKGSGSAGVNFLKEGDQLDAYIRFAVTGDNTDCPHTNSIEYVPVANFGDTENEVLDEIMQYADTCNVERDEVLGFIVCHEHYDMPYTFFITHIRG